MNGAAGGEAGDPGAADAVQAHRQPPQEPGRRPPQVPQLHHRHRPGMKFTAVTSSSLSSRLPPLALEELSSRSTRLSTNNVALLKWRSLRSLPFD